MHRPRHIDPIPQPEREIPGILESPKKTAHEIRKAQTGVRGAIKSLGAWGAIALASLAGGKVAGDASAKMVHRGVAPIIEGINEAVTPEMCKENYEGFKGIILGEMNGRIGKMINGVLDSVDMKSKIQKWLDAITKKMNEMREGLCQGLKKVPELTNDIDQSIQKFTKLMVRWMTTAILLLALSMIYRGHKRRYLKKLSDDAFSELEQELALTRTSNAKLTAANADVTARVERLEALLRKQGMLPPDDDERDD